MRKLNKLAIKLVKLPLAFIAFGSIQAPGAVVHDSAKVAEVAASTAWRNLLYYDSKGRSLVKSQLFFFDPAHGPTDAKAELKASLDAFSQSDPKSEVHPQCRFPARYELLRRHFLLSEPVRCPRYETWLEQYQPEELALVYASQFIASPASVFGHVLLAAPSTKQAKGLWLTYNYSAAMPNDVSGFSYIVGGISGWYNGIYSVLPYFNRLHVYGHIEDRDLWLYGLRLSEEERDFAIRHMWELVHSSVFSYFFFDENCAGALLRFFAAVLPDMADGNRLGLYVHPIQVIQRLERAGRIARVEYIPSHGNVLQNALQSLDREQRRQADTALKNPEQAPAAPDAAVSETVIEYLAFKRMKNSGELPAKYKDLDRWAHIERSKHRVPPIAFDQTEALKLAPHLAHESSSFQAGSSVIAGSVNTVDLQYRLSLHNLLDPEPGFIRNSTVDCMNTKISIHGNQVWLQELIFGKLENLLPLRSFDPKPSWRVQGAVKENLLTKNLRDQYMQLEGGVGDGMEIRKLYFYGMLSSDLNFGENLPQGNIEVGPEIGSVFSTGRFKIFARMSAGWDVSRSRPKNSAHLKASGGLRWTLQKNLIVVQETEWSRIASREQEGYRAGLGMRTYF